MRSPKTFFLDKKEEQTDNLILFITLYKTKIDNFLIIHNYILEMVQNPLANVYHYLVLQNNYQNHTKDVRKSRSEDAGGHIFCQNTWLFC